MIGRLLAIVFILVLACCKEKAAEYEPCESATDDQQLQVYNDLLIELVENHFFNLYHNEGIADSANFKTIYLSHRNYHKELFGELKAVLWKKPDVNGEIRPILAKYNADSITIFAGFTEAQQKYEAADFVACTFNIGSMGEAETIYDLEPKQKANAIGQVSFSEIHWDKQHNKGILYYEFYCGTKCGKGELIGFEKANGSWRIIDKVQIWVS